MALCRLRPWRRAYAVGAAGRINRQGSFICIFWESNPAVTTPAPPSCRTAGTLLSNCAATSAAEQDLYGGVVPEIASRRHIEHISSGGASGAGRGRHDAGQKSTPWPSPLRPGLSARCWWAVNFCQRPCLSAQKPLVPVHHLRGHIAALYLTHPELEPPFLCLVAIAAGTAISCGWKTTRAFRVLGADGG